jgi:hypothetical protein
MHGWVDSGTAQRRESRRWKGIQSPPRTNPHAGKAVIDATNPLSAWPKLEVLWDGGSAGELLQVRAGRELDLTPCFPHPRMRMPRALSQPTQS